MKKNMFSHVLSLLEKGNDIKVDLKRHNIIVNNRALVFHGETRRAWDWLPFEEIDPLKYLEIMYIEYMNSEPDGTGISKYFGTPVKVPDLYGEAVSQTRKYAKTALELFVFCAGACGLLQVPDGAWFYQSPNYDKLVVLKNWL